MAESHSQLDVRTIARVAGDVLHFVSSMLRPHVQLAAENLFLRKQLALHLERQVKPRRADNATRIALVALSRLIPRRSMPRDGHLPKSRGTNRSASFLGASQALIPARCGHQLTPDASKPAEERFVRRTAVDIGVGIRAVAAAVVAALSTIGCRRCRF
jgi:hypothetical protein